MKPIAKKYQQCTSCVLDTNDDPDIFFNEQGVCNHCVQYQKKYIQNALPQAQKKQELERIIQKIKSTKKGTYDSILGVSGGVDSSYLAYLCKEWGLHPLLVHFDNGWNSELAVQNIERMAQFTGFDLFTYVVDWHEFKELQLAYIRSGVLDWEIPTDHGFYACLHDQVLRHSISYILTGHNFQTEGILPKAMRWSKFDVANILDINKKYGTKPLKSFPLVNFWKYNYLHSIKKIETYSLLHYIPYDKNEAKKIITEKMGWRDYGGKHYESIFTRFYQGYVLKEKFGFDKRKAHLSTLINSGQMTREEALHELEKSAYDPIQLQEDKQYFIKKLEITEAEFDQIMKEKPRSHLEFKSYETGLYRKHEQWMKTLKPFTHVVKKIMRA